MTVTTLSPAGEAFIFDKESCPLRAYRDVGGVITIGPGLTMLSKVFASYWRQTRGHALQLGDTITRAEARKVFRTVIEQEYGPPVVKNIQPKEQHHYDGSASVSYNAGPASTTWKWAKALAQGNVQLAANMLLTTAITAGGRTINGLKNRRRHESRLIASGDYGNLAASTEGVGLPSGVSQTREEVAEYQRQLRTLGLYAGPANGTEDALTRGAVKNFQTQQGLRVDGIVGPATRAALATATRAKGQTQTTTGGGLVSGGGLGFGLQLDNPFTLLLIGGGVMLALFLLFLLWNNRGIILRKRTPV